MTVLAINGTLTIPIISAAPTRTCRTFAPLNAALLNIEPGSSGSSTERCLSTRTTSAAAAPRK